MEISKACIKKWDCYPMRIFLIFTACGLGSFIINIIHELFTNENLETKLKVEGALLFQYLCGILSCTLPIFLLINKSCKTSCNPVLGWFWLFGLPLIICICITLVISLGVFEIRSLFPDAPPSKYY